MQSTTRSSVQEGCAYATFHPGTLCIVWCVCLPIFLGVFLGVVLPDIKLDQREVHTQCWYSDGTADPYACCDKVGCMCANCDSNTMPTCSSALSLLIPGDCCNGYHCCQTRCETCCETEAYTETYRCNCRGSTSSRTCSTCTRTRYRERCFDCNCRCVQSVDNQQCNVACGTCHRLSAVLYVRLNGNAIPRPVESHCARDRADCAQAWLDRTQPDRRYECWVDKKNLNIRWEPREGNTAGLVFAILFGIPIGIWLLAAIVTAVLTAFYVCSCPTFSSSSSGASSSRSRSARVISRPSRVEPGVNDDIELKPVWMDTPHRKPYIPHKPAPPPSFNPTPSAPPPSAPPPYYEVVS